ncbi:MAG TPA: hypothetical protein PLV19_10990 [Nitrosomonas sp.]|nr:hypothetical protein [Nitrosomonas sp.]HQX14680.1 hypothetical protein [Nitrosomonas sp.]HRB78404.1 hypothetical protein [Nitrosomonas sp.]
MTQLKKMAQLIPGLSKSGKLTIEQAAYIEKVSELADAHSDELISNGSKDHAKVLIHALLSRAKSEVKLFSSYLSSDIYDDEAILDALDHVINDRKIKLEILLQEPENSIDENTGSYQESKFLNRCVSAVSRPPSDDSQIFLKISKKEHKDILSHFMTMDDDAYRFCEDKTNPNRQAVASFKRPKTVSNLKRQFDIMFMDAIDYQGAK